METRKQELIEKILQDPLDVSPAEFEELVSPELQLEFTDLRELILRLFDLNETALKKQSDVTTGLMGWLNKKSTFLRHKRYYRQIKRGFRSADFPDHKVIVAEGDSWFQFPFFVKDIVDWLSGNPNFAVYSIAYGGDWFTNILYDEKYIEELSIHVPEVFLISGGGNDLVAFNRLAVMVNAKGTSKTRRAEELAEMLRHEEKQDQTDILAGYPYITEAFYSFIWTIKAQYVKLFERLQNAGKFASMKIITQGYDYALPTYQYRWKKWYALQPLLNWLIGSGQWLKRPLMVKGLTDDYLSRQILKAMIFEINYMFSDLAQSFPNVYHLDCRGTAPHFNDWFDELHLHSEKFRVIADAYTYCIENDLPEKVIRVKAYAHNLAQQRRPGKANKEAKTD